MIEDMTMEEAVELAAEIADPNFIETYRRMKAELEHWREAHVIGFAKQPDGPPAFRKPEGVK